jgi:hypothetical protein
MRRIYPEATEILILPRAAPSDSPHTVASPVPLFNSQEEPVELSPDEQPTEELPVLSDAGPERKAA